MIRHNWKYKVLAVMVALILWTYVNSERNPQSRQTMTVRVQAINPTKGYVADLGSQMVSVTIEGLKTDVDSISKDEIEALVDLDRLHTGAKIVEGMLPVRVHLSRIPQDNNLRLDWAPKSIPVRMEAITRKQLPVDVEFASEPPLGYSYGNPVLSSENVTVTGKASWVSKVKRAVLTLNNDTSDGSTEDYYDVSPTDANGNVIDAVDVQPGRIKVKMDMVEVPATKSVLVSPLFNGEPKFPARVTKYTVTPSTIMIQGKPSVIAGINTIGTDRVMLDGADNTVTREVDLQLPSGVKVAGSKSVKVTVYISTD